MAVIGVILVTAFFGFFMVGYLLNIYFGRESKEFKLGLTALIIFILLFLIIFVRPLYQHMQDPEEDRQQEKKELDYAKKL